jgi:hypothetical protein
VRKGAGRKETRRVTELAFTDETRLGLSNKSRASIAVAAAVSIQRDLHRLVDCNVFAVCYNRDWCSFVAPKVSLQVLVY